MLLCSRCPSSFKVKKSTILFSLQIVFGSAHKPLFCHSRTVYVGTLEPPLLSSASPCFPCAYINTRSLAVIAKLPARLVLILLLRSYLLSTVIICNLLAYQLTTNRISLVNDVNVKGISRVIINRHWRHCSSEALFVVVGFRKTDRLNSVEEVPPIQLFRFHGV